MDIVLFVFLVAILSLSFAAFKYLKIKNYPVLNDKAKEISDAIRSGATAYLRRQYQGVSIFFAVIFLILLVSSFFGVVDRLVPYVFILGGFLSALSGFIGMRTATMANVRTVSAAQKGLNEGLKVAFSAGSVISFVIVGIGINVHTNHTQYN